MRLAAWSRVWGWILLAAVWCLAAGLVDAANGDYFVRAFAATIVVGPAAWIGWRLARVSPAP